jgi:hypothetical protein
MKSLWQNPHEKSMHTPKEHQTHLPIVFSSATISLQMLMPLEMPDGMQKFSPQLTNLFVI